MLHAFSYKYTAINMNKCKGFPITLHASSYKYIMNTLSRQCSRQLAVRKPWTIEIFSLSTWYGDTGFCCDNGQHAKPTAQFCLLYNTHPSTTSHPVVYFSSSTHLSLAHPTLYTSSTPHLTSSYHCSHRPLLNHTHGLNELNGFGIELSHFRPNTFPKKYITLRHQHGLPTHDDQHGRRSGWTCHLRLLPN